MPQTQADGGDEAFEKGTIEPDIDTPTAAIILAALAKAKREKNAKECDENRSGE